MSKEITMAEVRELKARLEVDIQHALNEFSQKTGCEVKSVDIHHLWRHGEFVPDYLATVHVAVTGGIDG